MAGVLLEPESGSHNENHNQNDVGRKVQTAGSLLKIFRFDMCKESSDAQALFSL